MPEGFAIALHLLADVAVGILGTLAVELVDRDDIGEIEHVDFLELALGAELGRHHVQRHVGQRHDRGITLADAGSLDDDQVEVADLAGGDRVLDHGRDFSDRISSRDRAHVNVGVIDGVHANAIAEQRTAGFAPGRVDCDDGDFQRIGMVEAEAADDFVGQRRLARTAGAGDAEHGRVAFGRRAEQFAPQRRRQGVVFERGDQARQRQRVMGAERIQRIRRTRGRIEVAACEHVVDQALQPHGLAVLRRIDAGDAVIFEFADLGRDDHATAAGKHADIGAIPLLQHVDHVLEVLDVAALVRRQRNRMGVFLDGGIDDFCHRTIVAEVNDLGARALQDAAHDVDRRVMAVEQAGGGDETKLAARMCGGGQIDYLVRGGTHRRVSFSDGFWSVAACNLRHYKLPYVYVNVNQFGARRSAPESPTRSR